MGNTAEKRADGSSQPRASLARRNTGDVVKQILMKGPITEKYDVDLGTVLGKGHYAVVNLARNRETNEQVAVKRIQINRSRVEALKQEIMVLMEVELHPIYQQVLSFPVSSHGAQYLCDARIVKLLQSF